MQGQSIPQTLADIFLPKLNPVNWWRGLWKLTPTLITPSAPVIQRPNYYELYRERRNSLPIAFSSEDWHRALEYWDYRCAICERPRGLWHTISQDHWIPLTSPNCPGTLPTNILPLCYGADGCNNSKGKKEPDLWLREQFGTRKANRKLRQIQDYFVWVATFMEPVEVILTCPDCDHPLQYQGRRNLWHCEACGAYWRERLN